VDVVYHERQSTPPNGCLMKKRPDTAARAFWFKFAAR